LQKCRSARKAHAQKPAITTYVAGESFHDRRGKTSQTASTVMTTHKTHMIAKNQRNTKSQMARHNGISDRPTVIQSS